MGNSEYVDGMQYAVDIVEAYILELAKAGHDSATRDTILVREAANRIYDAIFDQRDKELGRK